MLDADDYPNGYTHCGNDYRYRLDVNHLTLTRLFNI
jgi:hypothetical protein